MKMLPMTLTLPLEPQEEATLVAAARAKAVSLESLVHEALGNMFAEAAAEPPAKEPTLSVRGLLAKYGPAPSAGEIDRNRAEMFANFPCADFRWRLRIADTHTTLWYLFSDPRLGGAASAFIDATVADGNHIGVSAISPAEMVYLIEKSRIPRPH